MDINEIFVIKEEDLFDGICMKDLSSYDDLKTHNTITITVDERFSENLISF